MTRLLTYLFSSSLTVMLRVEKPQHQTARRPQQNYVTLAYLWFLQ